jgi:oligoendopeptidase F
VNENLPTLWRYLKLRKRIMDLDELRYSDLYASIVKDVDIKYSVDEAKDLVLKGVAPLGEDYVEILAHGLDNRWVDWHPTTGKRSGAYSNGSIYDLHPFILLNYTGTCEEVSTLAHEAGHAMHSYFSNKYQPYPTSRYTIFVAEVASTCNEHLLMDYMYKNTDDDAVKLFLLGSYIDGIRQTLFRQTQFAEFELKIHEMVEKGEALTGDKLNDVYAEIINKYYGVEEGITSIDPVCYVEWAYIPHFYYNFYVYSYSTSITASTAISQMILEGKPGAVENYRKFLTLGDSMPPVEELKVAGVDMTTDQPFDVTMRALDKAMDEMEKILDRM